MTSLLRTLQLEWNTLVPQAQARRLPRVRPLRVDAAGVPVPLETIAYRRAKLEWLKAQLGPQDSFETLTFGVELEFICPDRFTLSMVAQSISDAGVPCSAQVYNHTAGSTWKIVTDGSVRGVRTGGELVSPPLRGEAGFAQLRKACEVLTRIGAKVNRTCGFHVHVGAANQHVGFFKNLATLYASAEGAIDQFMAPSRRAWQNNYCQPVRIDQGRMDRATTVSQVANAMGQSGATARGGRDATRYRKLNFQSFWQHGTVEFRHHQGTVEAQKAENWTRLCLRMCLAAADPSPKRATTVDELFEVVKAADAERSFFQGRVEYFRSRPNL